MKRIFYISLILIACSQGKISNYLADDIYEPISETKQYEIYSFHVVDQIDTTGMMIINIPDTIQISWNQPKVRRQFDLQPIPDFYAHDDTIFSIIKNDSNLYKYSYTGNDTSVFVSGVIDGLYSGVWEFSVVCVDTNNLRSQFSESCLRYIKKELIEPSAPIDVWIILK